MTTPGHHERPDPAVPQPSWSPHPKIAFGALSSALAVIALWGIGLTGITIPTAVAGAVTTVVFSVVAYLVPAESA